MTPSRKSPDFHDSIQEAAIEQMHRLGLKPDEVKVDPALVRPDHVVKWLSRHAPMTTHKAQHVLAALGLGVKP